MFSAINALRFSSLKAGPAAAPIVQPALRFAARNDAFVRSVRFGDGDELEDGTDDTGPDVVITEEEQDKLDRAAKIDREREEHAKANED